MPEPLTFRGTDAKEFPSMKDLDVSSLQRWLFVPTVGGSKNSITKSQALVGPIAPRRINCTMLLWDSVFG
jgi:hypothetical protein